jgi:hypothetical protein
MIPDGGASGDFGGIFGSIGVSFLELNGSVSKSTIKGL